MKMTFGKEKHFLIGVRDIHRRRNSVVRITDCTPYDLKCVKEQ